MEIVCIGDLHCKNREPHKTAIYTFLDWLLNKYGDAIIIQVGDLWDASPHNSMRLDIANYFKEFRHVVIMNGNHDLSRRAGSSNLFLDALDNVTVIEDVQEVTFNMNSMNSEGDLVYGEQLKCLFLPFKYGCKEEYEALV